MIYLMINSTGDIEYGTLSRKSPLQVEQMEDFFVEYPSPCWTYVDGKFELKADADIIRSELLPAPDPAPDPVV